MPHSYKPEQLDPVVGKKKSKDEGHAGTLV